MNNFSFPHAVKRSENGRPVWRAFIAFRLLDIQNIDIASNPDVLSQHQREIRHKEQVDLINTFYQPDKIHSIEYRLHLNPARSQTERNQIDIFILLSVDAATKPHALARARELADSAIQVIQSSSEMYSLELVTDPAVCGFLLNEDSVRGDLCDIRRRVSWITNRSIVPRLQVGITGKTSTQGKTEKIVFVHPYIPVKNGYARLFHMLSRLDEPVVISFRISPTRMLTKEIDLLQRNIGICEDVASHYPGTYTLNKEQAQNLAIVLLSNYLSLQDAPFLLQVMVASPQKIPPGLTEVLGTEITKPVGGHSFDIPGLNNEQLAGYSGGYDIYSPQNETEKKLYIDSLIWHDNNFFTSAPDATEADLRLQFLFDASEAASAFHLPYCLSGDLAGIPIRWHKVKPIPNELLNLPKKARSGLVGINNYLGVKSPFYLPDEARRRHMYIVGQTGTGKSSVLISMILSDIQNGKGVGVLDPHGDLLEYILLNIPDERMNDVVLIDPSVRDYVIGINILEHDTIEQQNFIIQELIAMTKSLFDPGQRHGWAGPVFEDISRIALTAIMNYSKEAPSFIEFPLFFYSKNFREKVISTLREDPLRLANFPFLDLGIENFSSGRDFADVASYVVSKYGRIVSDPSLRDILCQRKSTISFDDILNNQKILLVNLNRALIGSLSSEWLGMFILTKIETAAMKRVHLPEKQRKDFYLYIDEFQNSATENFTSILSESRKYHLNLTLANQYVMQIPEEIRNAIFGNVGTLVALRVGQMDAQALAYQFSPFFKWEDFIQLPNWKGIVASTATGKRLSPFTIETLPYSPQQAKQKQKIKKIKRNLTKRWGKERSEVADRIQAKILEYSSFLNPLPWHIMQKLDSLNQMGLL